MVSRTIHCITGALSCAITAGVAATTVLNIDPLTGMTNAPGTPVPIASQVSDQFVSQGVLVSSTGGFAAVAKGPGVHWFPDPVLQNGLGGTSSGGTLSYNDPVVFHFVDPANPDVARATTSFSLYTDYQGIGAVCSLIAYDTRGTIVDSDVKREHSGFARTGTKYSVTGIGIAKVEFIGAGTQAVSNIQFEPPTSTCAADLNGDGVVDAADLAILLGAWNGSGAADLDGSGAVGAADLAILLGAWGPCG